MEPAQTVLAARALGVSPMVFVRAVRGVFEAALGMCAAVLALRVALVDGGVAMAPRLALCVLAGVGVYAVLCWWRVPELAGEARELVARRRAGARPSAPPSPPRDRRLRRLGGEANEPARPASTPSGI